MGTTTYAMVNRRAVLAAAYRKDGLLGVIRAAYPIDGRAWAIAMLAYAGPRELREEHVGEDGRPTPAALERFPPLARAMGAAHRDLIAYLALA